MQNISLKCRAEEVIVTTDEDVIARVMQITKGEGAWASINPIGGEASRYLPACELNPSFLSSSSFCKTLLRTLLC